MYNESKISPDYSQQIENCTMSHHSKCISKQIWLLKIYNCSFSSFFLSKLNTQLHKYNFNENISLVVHKIDSSMAQTSSLKGTF